MNETLRDQLIRAFALYDELAATLSAEDLARDLPGLPSNSIGQQLWCVVGARESYARAIAAGEWQGFECSMTAEDCGSPDAVAAALKESTARAVEGMARSEGTPPFALDLLEHEAMHQGQLIRYLYGLRLEIPAGWKARWALT